MQTFFENVKLKIYADSIAGKHSFKSHFHNKIEIFYCFYGEQKIKIGDKIYAVKSGDAAVIFPNEIHEYIEFEGEQPYTKGIAIICETDFLAVVIPELIKTRPLSPIVRADRVPEDAALSFERFCTAQTEPEKLGWTFIALSGLLKELRLVPLNDKIKNFDVAQALVLYINENFKKPLTIDRLSKKFGYSSSYITHMFYEQLKIPFRTYLNDVRTECAAHLLDTTRKNVTEIAYESGYSSVNTFCRCFKKRFSVTPSEYRKRNKKTN